MKHIQQQQPITYTLTCVYVWIYLLIDMYISSGMGCLHRCMPCPIYKVQSAILHFDQISENLIKMFKNLLSAHIRRYIENILNSVAIGNC